ncbi:MAG: adenylosuccinate synthase [Myxococcales bacterium]|nr:adenylosuccinate synthase [Myxococcales bacterium]
MTVTAIVGAQWGDEGKGRVVDALAQRADVVVRFQGGDNAGHTVVNGFGRFALHLVPSGIFNPQTACIIGAGTVVNPAQLLDEMAALTHAGVSVDNLWLERRAHLLLPIHRALDGLAEDARAEGERIGTTRRGIGPAYADKAARTGLRLGDLLRPARLAERLDALLAERNRQLVEHDRMPLDAETLRGLCAEWAAALGPRIVDTLPRVRTAVQNGDRVLLEGQLGVMRDLDWGTYPFVTSSSPTAAGACLGAGVPPQALDEVLGVVKVYTTAVGGGPFPVELRDAEGDRLRALGAEYGATTGRPRRCGWFDGVAIGYASWLNGFTGLAVTKVDVLDAFDVIPICVGYRLDGKVLDFMPDADDLARVEPIYETWPGWRTSTREARTWSALPAAARAYLRRLSELAGAPIRYVSVGPERDALIVVDHLDIEGESSR